MKVIQGRVLVMAVDVAAALLREAGRHEDAENLLACAEPRDVVRWSDDEIVVMNWEEAADEC